MRMCTLLQWEDKTPRHKEFQLSFLTLAVVPVTDFSFSFCVIFSQTSQILEGMKIRQGCQAPPETQN
jgi:hypothetical protein